MDKKPIKTLLIDDHPIVLNGLKGILGNVDILQIIGDASNGAEAMLILENSQLDLIISDITMPAMDGIELTEIVKNKFPDIKIILLTAYNEKEILKRALQSGAEACLLKNTSKKELLSAIERVMDNGYYYCDNLLEIAQNINDESIGVTQIEKVDLSERELEVLEQLLKGKPNKEVATILNISYHTVTTHRRNIMKKTKSHSISDLFNFAKRNNLLQS